MEQTTRVSEIDEERLKLLTLEDCLNLALKLRILSQSPDAETSASRLCLRLVWMLTHSGSAIQSARLSHLQRLGKDLSLFLSRFPRHRPDLDLYQFRDL